MAMWQLMPGQVFAGRYRVQRELARGGMGLVYEAEHVQTEQPVALKVLLPSALPTATAEESFKVEATIAAKLDSEHVVRVFDAGVDDETGAAFIVMELLVGETLQQAVTKHGPLAKEAVVSIFRELGTALDRAHHYVDRDGSFRPIVHRDLKPENLFLTEREDGSLRLKVLDFGIAKVLSDSTNVSTHVKGTPLFMAYEQVAGRPSTPAVDVWAVGLIAFHALSGRYYWKAAANDVPAEALFAEILHGALPKASKRAAEVGGAELPVGFDAWFSRCVVRDPARRFPEALDASKALLALLGADPESVPPGRRSTGSNSDALDRVQVGLASTVAVTTTGRRTAKRRRSRRVTMLASGLVAIVLAGLLLARALLRHGQPPLARSASARAAAPPPPASVATAPKTVGSTAQAETAASSRPAPAASHPAPAQASAPPVRSAERARAKPQPVHHTAKPRAPKPTDNVWGIR